MIIRSTFSAIALGLLFSIPYAAPLQAAAKFDDSLNLMTIAKLPACNVNNSGSSAAVSDYAGSITWGSPVGTGGGTGVAKLYCNGASWTVFAGGGGGTTPSTQQNLVLAAPITPATADSSNLRYNDGCTGSPGAASASFPNHTCLMFDDHWTTTATSTTPASALNTTAWYAGYMRCNGGTGGNANCTNQTTGGTEYPATGWCYIDNPGCFNTTFYDYPFGVQTSIGLTGNTLSIAADGSLDLAQTYYGSPAAGQKVSCNFANGNSFLNCNQIYWIGAGITTGGLASPTIANATVRTPAALIPNSGGMVQARVKFDAGLNTGVFGSFECDIVDGATGVNGGGSTGSNANFEMGYTYGGLYPGVQGYGQGLSDVDNISTATAFVNTGDDGVGVGDMRNWHTFALEWTGSGTHQWNYYIDGVAKPVGGTRHTHTAPVFSASATGYTCALTAMMAVPSENAHSQWNLSSPGGPFHLYVGDVQVYKKPGT